MGRLQRVTAAGPDKVPLLRAPVAPIQVASRTWRRCPREQESSEAQEGWGAGRRDCSGVRPRGSCAPSAAAWAPIAALLPRVGLRRQRPGLLALPRSQRVRFSFTTKSPRHRSPTEGQSRQAAPAGRERGRDDGGERARQGRVACDRGRQLDLLVSQLQ